MKLMRMFIAMAALVCMAACVPAKAAVSSIKVEWYKAVSGVMVPMEDDEAAWWNRNMKEEKTELELSEEHPVAVSSLDGAFLYIPYTLPKLNDSMEGMPLYAYSIVGEGTGASAETTAPSGAKAPGGVAELWRSYAVIDEQKVVLFVRPAGSGIEVYLDKTGEFKLPDESETVPAATTAETSGESTAAGPSSPWQYIEGKNLTLRVIYKSGVLAKHETVSRKERGSKQEEQPQPTTAAHVEAKKKKIDPKHAIPFVLIALCGTLIVALGIWKNR